MEKRTKKTEARTKLLQTGLRLFAENGFNGTGIKEIVDEVGVPKGSFYNYFKSKEDFTVEIIQFYSDNLSILWDDFLKSGPSEPLESLQRIRREGEAFAYGPFACRSLQQIMPEVLDFVDDIVSVAPNIMG